MDSITLFVLALGLSMDAFAVSISNSMCFSGLRRSEAALTSLSFGVFQGLMPVAGYFAGRAFAGVVSAFDHWIAFVLLLWIGVRMIREALGAEEDNVQAADPSRGLTMVALAFATSIDALAVGLTLAMIEVAIWMPALIIGLVACALTIAGLLLGCRAGERWGRRVGVAGGIILILIGGKILFSALLLPKAIAASIG